MLTIFFLFSQAHNFLFLNKYPIISVPFYLKTLLKKRFFDLELFHIDKNRFGLSLKVLTLKTDMIYFFYNTLFIHNF